MIEKMTVNQYSAYSGRLKQAISRDLKNNKPLKGVEKREKIGRTHILHVNITPENQ